MNPIKPKIILDGNDTISKVCDCKDACLRVTKENPDVVIECLHYAFDSGEEYCKKPDNEEPVNAK